MFALNYHCMDKYSIQFDYQFKPLSLLSPIKNSPINWILISINLKLQIQFINLAYLNWYESIYKTAQYSICQ